jgi:beta-lactamase superfamily II metal-dependent hydrolase
LENNIGCEIDFLPVGNGDKSGDAIAVRYGSFGNYKIMVYDGGTKESGEALVDHIRKYYGTSRIDYVVNSHPDSDHASGLSVVLEKLDVGELWMHRPWEHSSKILNSFRDGRITKNSLSDRLKESLNAAYRLEELAKEKNILIHEPFSGNSIGDFIVLSPEKEWYSNNLIPEFNKSPEQKEIKESYFNPNNFLQSLNEGISYVRSILVNSSWDFDTLSDDVETSAENESSVILFWPFKNHPILLTGDAGIHALEKASYFAELKFNVHLHKILKFIQIPHHGSRHNVSSSLLDKIVGMRKDRNDGLISKTAFVSSSKESTIHPRKAVINSFIRRGVKVFNTQGRAIRHPFNMPKRQGWVPLTPVEFSDEEEVWD